MQPRMQTKYREVVLPQLQKEFEYGNVMQVPALEKIVVNTCLKDAITNQKILDVAAAEIGLITGQKPVITKSKKANASFKLREGMPIGVKVTLRKNKMYEFVDRFVNIALPRVRDFRGVNTKSFDGNGNYALGLKEQYVFPEIEYDNVDSARGMDIIFVTSAKSDEEARELLNGFDFPFNE